MIGPDPSGGPFFLRQGVEKRTMTTVEWGWSHDCSFPSGMDTAHSLIDTIMGKLQGTEWSSKEQFAINLALEEALVNAVQHGNRSDPSKNVHFSCKLTRSLAKFRVEDEGDGFDPSAVPDPTDDDHILIASGRGVLLIKGFVSRVWWNDKGNVLEFEKDRSE